MLIIEQKLILLLLSHILGFDYFNWKLIENTNVLVFDLAARRFGVVLLLSGSGCFEYHILST
jgi:hypothetical protein